MNSTGTDSGYFCHLPRDKAETSEETLIRSVRVRGGSKRDGICDFRSFVLSSVDSGSRHIRPNEYIDKSGLNLPLAIHPSNRPCLLPSNRSLSSLSPVKHNLPSIIAANPECLFRVNTWAHPKQQASSLRHTIYIYRRPALKPSQILSASTRLSFVDLFCLLYRQGLPISLSPLIVESLPAV